MKPYIQLFLFWSFVLVLFPSCHTDPIVTLENLPKTTPDSAKIYIAGSFNNWRPGVDSFQLESLEDGSYRIFLKGVTPPFEYKFTRGNWETVECKYDGREQPNRVFRPNTAYATAQVENWLDKSSFEDRTTAASNVIELDSNFYIPQLNRFRAISIYLPPDYHTSKKDYPVLYMHDCQNIFDEATAYSQTEWQVDETLNQLHTEGKPTAIVVGINNGDRRTEEYSPWEHNSFSKPEGKQYAQFIAETLKPYVDSNFRTKPKAEHTGIMGSSMGGLISMYAGLEYPTVFGRIGVFSPSFWISKDAFKQVDALKTTDLKIYMNVGTKEGGTMQENVAKMKDILKDKGFTDENLRVHVVEGGGHHESLWAAEFPKAFEFLFLE